jgi:hypothetical protein
LANPHEHKSRINLPMRKGTKQNGHSRADQTWTVVDDFPDVVPVTPEELAVVEAFLLAQFQAVMEGENPLQAAATAGADSETPQTNARLALPAQTRRKARRKA